MNYNSEKLIWNKGRGFFGFNFVVFWRIYTVRYLAAVYDRGLNYSKSKNVLYIFEFMLIYIKLSNI